MFIFYTTSAAVVEQSSIEAIKAAITRGFLALSRYSLLKIYCKNINA
jgi:hypothetical protein